MQYHQGQLSGSCGRHPAVERVVVLFEALVDFPVVHALVPEKRLTQLVVATVVEGTGMETRLFTRLEKGVVSTDSDFLYTHGLLENCLQFKVYDVFLGGMQRNNLVLPLSIRRLKPAEFRSVLLNGKI